MKRLEIGVAADRSLATIFEPLIASLARATDALNKFEGKVKTGVKAATDSAGAEANKMAAQAAKAFAQMESASAKAAAKEIADADRIAQAKERSLQRDFDKRLRLAKQAADAEEREKGERERRAVGIGRDAMHTFAGVARTGVGVAGDIARGAGVNFDLSSSVARGVSLESTAARTTTSAATAVGKTASAEDIKATMEIIQKAGKDTALDFNKLANGLEDFVSKSSDLKTGGAILGQLGLIARATGTDVEKLVSSAGDVNKTLDDSPDKAQRLLAIMRLVAKQGAMGNVEVKDLATYMGKMISSGFMFEGSIDKNIGILGAMSQVAMKGGASTAADATRAADAFSRDLTKGAALERFKKAGIEIFADPGEGPGKNTKLLSPEKIITSFMEKSGGNLAMLADLFQNEMSKKVLKGFGNVAEQASKRGEDPIEAVRKEFAKFTASLTEGDVAKAAGVSMGTAEARAQAFQNNLDLVASSLAERVLPQLEKLAPKALELADALGRVVGWASENPGSAITAAIIASISKAAIGNLVGTALENALKTAGATAGGKGLGLAIGAATIGITVGSILVAKLQEDVGKGREAATGQIAANEAVLTKAEKEFKETGSLSPETIASLEKQRGVVEGQIKEGQAAPSAESTKGLGGIPMFFKDLFGIESYEQQGRKAGARDAMGQLTGESKGIDALLAAVNDLKTVTAANKPPKSVMVENMPGGPIAGGGTSNTGAPVLTGKR